MAQATRSKRPKPAAAEAPASAAVALLAELKARLAPYLARCMKCGFCRAPCAVVHELARESYSARAKVRLARAIVAGEMAPDDPDFVRLLHQCLMCRGCQANCPSGVETAPIFEELRALVLRAGGKLPEGPAALREALLKDGNPFAQPQSERGAWLPPNLRAPRPAETLYFAGCATSYGQNRLGRAALRLLERAGVELTALGAEEACCGDPALRLGDRELAAALVERNRAACRRLGVKRIVTACAGCTKRLKESLGGEFKVLHLTELLLEEAAAGRLTLRKEYPRAVAYFDGCDLGRGAGVYEPPRELLRRVPKLRLVEFPNARAAQLCCGGPLTAGDPELAARIGRSRIAEARAAGAELLVTPCPTCLVTLREAGGAELRVVDLGEFLLPLLG